MNVVLCSHNACVPSFYRKSSSLREKLGICLDGCWRKGYDAAEQTIESSTKSSQKCFKITTNNCGFESNVDYCVNVLYFWNDDFKKWNWFWKWLEFGLFLKKSGLSDFWQSWEKLLYFKNNGSLLMKTLKYKFKKWIIFYVSI